MREIGNMERKMEQACIFLRMAIFMRDNEKPISRKDWGN